MMASSIIGTVLSLIVLILGKVAFIWAPLIAMYMGFQLWHHFVTERFILGMSWTLFEIEVPRDVEKSPMAMELVFTNSMYHASQKGLWEIWIQGAPHFWFSLEIAGIDGNVHFYIRTPSRIRDLVETQVYAQYPQAKVKEVEDYTHAVDFDAPNNNYYVWGAEFVLENADGLPIRTYVDYGLDKPSDKETLKIDPLTPTIEYLGSLKRGQQIWIQHVIRPSLKSYHSHHGKGHIGWVAAALEEIDTISAPYTQEFYQSTASQDAKAGHDIGVQIRLPKPAEDKVEKIREKISKLGFDVGTRVLVIADAKSNTLADFDGMRRSSRLLFRQYNAPSINSLVRVNATQFGSPFADPTGVALWRMKNRMLNWYRHRIFYHPPLWRAFNWPGFLGAFFRNNPPGYSVLNVEELATIFHFPGQVSQAPSFQRVESRTAKPPSNLPI
jgi:hypothetical protein